jgi:hypothetical protein
VDASSAQSLVDYYAGISALLVVILFAKFTTHQARLSRADSRGSSRDVGVGWKWAHLLSVAAAFLGVCAALAELGWGGFLSMPESVVRPGVAVAGLLATAILAVDVAAT